MVLATLLAAGAALAQDAERTVDRVPDAATDGMPIQRVELEGLKSINESFVRRIIKTRIGQSFTQAQLQEDVRELLRTRKFLNVAAVARAVGGQADVTIRFQEKPETRSIEIEGAKQFKLEDLMKELTISIGAPLDRYEINRSRDNLERRYREGGYYYVQVTVDEMMLANEGRVVFRIVEGPRVRVRSIVLEGNNQFPEPTLRFKIRSETWFPILRKGAFDPEQADRDAAELQSFFRNEAFLDARVGYRLDFVDVERTDARLVFVIEQGDRYTVKELLLEGAETFEDETLRETMQLRPGDLARDEALKADVRRLQDKYGEIGFVDARVETEYRFLADQPGQAVILLDIQEGPRSRFGRITVRGNTRTKDQVIRRELRFYPGEDYNTLAARRAERRLLETTLFSKASITPLRDEDGLREALVEIEEAETFKFLIGFGVSTDSGIIGSLTIEQRNFDLFNWPRSFGEFFRAQSFRGAGQRLRLSLEPGTEVSRFRLDFSEPYLFDLPLRYDQSLYLFQRGRDSYDEERIGFLPSLSRRFESGLLAGWAIEGALRFEQVRITDVNPLAANDILDAKGSNFLSSVKFTIVRDTTDSRLLPTEGYRVAFAWEQYGLLGGDFFSKPTISAAWYKTLRTDLFDRKSVLQLRADAGWIIGDSPVYERFYAGGFGSMRGFDFRGISPRAGIYNDKVGGEFILLTGAEYSFPLYANNVRGVAFVDMGTVERDFNITGWRASVGFGFRINLDFFGPIPIVIDFGFPIMKEDQDNTQYLQFSIGATF